LESDERWLRETKGKLCAAEERLKEAAASL